MNGKKVFLNGKQVQISSETIHWLPVEPAVKSFFHQYLKPDDRLRVQTSGSTGEPKTMEVSKAYMRASARKTIEFLKLQKSDPALLCLSADHIAGMMMLVRWLEGELDLYSLSPVASPLEEISGEFEFSAMVPYQVYHSLDQLQRVKKLIIGGGAIPADLEKQLIGRGTQIYHTYGMTETLSHVAMRQISPHLEDHFVAMPRCSFGKDNRNCLVINAPDIGVHKLQTNDVVKLIDDQSFIWLGRWDNVVNSGGVKLHPERIERKMGDIGRAFFLVGIKDAALGQKLVMIIEGDPISDEKLLKKAMQKLRTYEKPRSIRYIQEFERTPTGKIRRQNIIDRL